MFVRTCNGQDIDEFDCSLSDTVVVVVQGRAEVSIHRNVQLLSSTIHLKKGLERSAADSGVGAESVSADQGHDLEGLASITIGKGC